MGRKTPPFKHYNSWTTARFFSFISSALRSAWMRYPVKYEVLNDACVGVKINKQSGRPAKHYECALCGRTFTAKSVQVDHVVPVGSLRSFDDIQGVCERLFCGKDDLQLICSYKGKLDGIEACHKIKTRKEKKLGY